MCYTIFYLLDSKQSRSFSRLKSWSRENFFKAFDNLLNVSNVSKIDLVLEVFSFEWYDISCRNKGSEDGAASGRNTSLESQEPVVDADDTDGAAVAPRVKLAADGTIILDEERYVCRSDHINGTISLLPRNHRLRETGTCYMTSPAGSKRSCNCTSLIVPLSVLWTSPF